MIIVIYIIIKSIMTKLFLFILIAFLGTVASGKTFFFSFWHRSKENSDLRNRSQNQGNISKRPGFIINLFISVLTLWRWYILQVLESVSQCNLIKTEILFKEMQVSSLKPVLITLNCITSYSQQNYKWCNRSKILWKYHLFVCFFYVPLD